MSIHNAEFRFNKELDPDAIIKQILKDPKNQEYYKLLSENFFLSDAPLVIGDGIENLYKDNEKVYYNYSKGAFCSHRPGFLKFKGFNFEVISPIVVLKNKLRAFLILPPLDEKTLDISEKEIELEIKNSGLHKVLNKEKILPALQAAKKGRGIILPLAKGERPKNGSVYKINLFINIDKEVGTMHEDGRMDYKEKNSIKNISKGDVLGEYIPEVKPEKGIDVFGDFIEPNIDNEYTFILGEGIEKNENNQLIAATNGIFTVKDKKISISETLIIPGDVNLETGHIKTKVSAIIEGKIDSGFSVQTGKDLTVKGMILKANAHVGRNLEVATGIIGEGNNSKIIAKENIKAEFFENTTIWAGGDIEFNKSIIHSNISCAGKLIAKGKGVVLGGKITSSHGVEINDAGSKVSIPTTIIVGIDLRRDIKRKQLQKELSIIELNISKNKLAIGEKYFENPKQFINSLPEHKLREMERYLTKLQKLLKRRKEIQLELIDLNRLLTYKEAQIIIKGVIYDGVTLFFGNNKFQVNQKMQNVIFYWDDKEKEITFKYR